MTDTALTFTSVMTIFLNKAGGVVSQLENASTFGGESGAGVAAFCDRFSGVKVASTGFLVEVGAADFSADCLARSRMSRTVACLSGLFLMGRGVGTF